MIYSSSSLTRSSCLIVDPRWQDGEIRSDLYVFVIQSPSFRCPSACASFRDEVFFSSHMHIERSLGGEMLRGEAAVLERLWFLK